MKTTLLGGAIKVKHFFFVFILESSHLCPGMLDRFSLGNV